MLVVPLLCKLVRLPQIVGFILAGIAIGNNGLCIIPQNETINIVGKVGMIYLMFLSGIEIDMDSFRRSRLRSLFFGNLTFLFPCLLGIFTSRLFGFDWLSAVLMGAMYGSHALMTYPIVSRYNLQQQNIVSVVVGGTMLAVILSLLCLGVVSAVETGETGITAILRMLGYLLILLIIVAGLFPYIASWFIKRNNDSVAEFLFVMLLVGLASWFADKAGLEAILGAFVAGVALNKRIPALSPLMNRINFVGNTFFIPVFLISVGMMIDLRVSAVGWGTLVLATIMILTKLCGKWLAALTTTILLKLNNSERRLTFGLSSASTAGTLAVVTIGYNIGLLPIEVLNAALLLILVSCIVASFITENAARTMAHEEKAGDDGFVKQQKVLISLHNPATDTALVDIALLTTSPRRKTLFAALAVCNSHEDEQQANNIVRHAAQYAASADRHLQMLTKVAANMVNGILQVEHNEHFTRIVVGLNSPDHTSHGNVALNLLQLTTEQIMLYKQVQPLNTVERLRIIVPRHAEQEPGFVAVFECFRYLAMQTSARITFYCDSHSEIALRQLCTREKKSLTASFIKMTHWEDTAPISKEMERNDMLILLLSRQATVSYNPLFETAATLVDDYYKQYNTLLIYPEQNTPIPDSILQDSADYSDHPSIFRHLFHYLRSFLHK